MGPPKYLGVGWGLSGTMNGASKVSRGDLVSFVDDERGHQSINGWDGVFRG